MAGLPHPQRYAILPLQLFTFLYQTWKAAFVCLQQKRRPLRNGRDGVGHRERGTLMMKKTFYTEWAYVAGLLLIAAGVVLMEKADFGMSMIVAPAYLLHR